MTRSLLLAGFAATTMLVQPAFAQVAFELDEIIVSGNFDETTLERIGATASVVTRENLEETGELRAIDFLARLPGIDVRSRGPVGGLSSITIRGAGQNYVRVLVDGIDVADPSGPQMAYDFGGLRTSDIDRIEVLRGGQSALYGSSSTGGVINITTRRAVEEGTTQYLTMEAGSYDTLNASYGVTTRSGAFDYALTLSAMQTDGFSAADEDDGNTEADGYDAQRLSFAFGYNLSNGARVGVNGFVEDATAEFDEQFPLADGSTDEYSDNVSQGVRAYAEFQTGAVANEVALTYYNITRKSYGSTDFGTANVVYEGERVGVSYLGQMALGAALDLRFGADYVQETYDQSGDFGLSDGKYDTAGIYAELAYGTDSMGVVGTVRHDEHSEFGGFTAGRLALNWRPAAEWTVRASAATSYRAPSLYELYGPFGDATMVAEEGRSVDLGIERRLGEASFVRATAFYNETDNLIDFPFPYANVPGTVVRQGVELEAGFAISDAWRMDASYTYVEGENPDLTAGNAWNLEFPEHDLSLTVSGDVTDKLSAAFTVQHAAGRQVLGDYTVANATFGYDVADGVEAYVRVENLFDEDYQLTSGYGTSDRAIYAGVRAEFNAILIAGLVFAGPATTYADTAPARVVSMNLCTDQLAMLVADPKQLISVSRLSQDPRGSAMAKQAQNYIPNSGFAEEIYLMQPDLVIAGSFSTPATTAMLQRLGVPVVVFDYASSLDDIRDRLGQMGEVLGQVDRAARVVADFDTRLAAFRAEVSSHPRAALYYANGYTSGDSTLAGQILVAAGFVNVAGEAGFPFGGFMPLEVLAMTDPDAIITSDSADAPSRSEEILSHPVVQALRQNAGAGWFSDRDWACGTPFVLDAIERTAALRRQHESDVP